jgi:hypothetical protein
MFRRRWTDGDIGSSATARVGLPGNEGRRCPACADDRAELRRRDRKETFDGYPARCWTRKGAKRGIEVSTIHESPRKYDNASIPGTGATRHRQVLERHARFLPRFRLNPQTFPVSSWGRGANLASVEITELPAFHQRPTQTVGSPELPFIIDTSQRLGRHRWVVERTRAWLNTFRLLCIRDERRADIHQAWLCPHLLQGSPTTRFDRNS